MTTTRTRKTAAQLVAFHEAEAKKARKTMQQQERALDTRRKIILGGVLLDMVKGGHSRSADAKALYEIIVPNLVRPHDREAFGLDPLPVQKP